MVCARLSSVCLSFGDRDLLKDIDLTLDTKSRMALAGENGSGKSTLMRIIAGLQAPDSGEAWRAPGTIIAYLPQSGLEHSGNTLFQEAETAFARFREIESRKIGIEERLSESNAGDEQLEPLLEEHDELQQHLIRSEYYEREERIHRVLIGLGFGEDDFGKRAETFSGGWQMRIGLARVLLENPDLVLLDEPTNYLDIEARTWLESFLESFSGGVVVVSHDRYFLDVTVGKVAELLRGKLTLYHGNYTHYLKQRETEMESLLASYKRQQEEIDRMESFIRRFRYNASKARQVQSRIKQLEKMERIEIPESMKRIRFTFPPAPHSGKIVLKARDLCKSYGDLKVLEDVTFTLERGDRMVLVGKNGAGKTTLMKILAGRLDPDKGSIEYGAGVRVGYFSQELESLPEEGTVYDVAAEDAPTELIPQLRSLLGAFLFRGEDIEKPVSVLSGGERSRLVLLTLLLHPVNLLVLDEPTNHLDMASKSVLLNALEDFGGTLVFVSHDRYFIEDLAERVLELRAGSWRLFPGDYPYYLRRIEQEENIEDEGGAPDSGAEGEASRSHAASLPSNTPGRSGSGGRPAGRETGSGDAGRTLERAEKKRLQSSYRKLRKREEEIVGRLEEIDAEHDELLEEMASEEVYTDGERVRSLKSRIEELERARRRQSELWSETEDELNRIDTTRNSLSS